eukprot:gene8169-12629_t
MSEEKVYQPLTKERGKNSHVKSMNEYQKIYDESINNNDKFWEEIAKNNFYWKENWKNISSSNFDIKKGKVEHKWFEGAKTNLSYNCLDRHLEKNGDGVAFYWEGNEPEESQAYTYKQLHEQVCKFSNVLLDLGLKKGDRLAIYLPMVIELVVSVLACARIGIIHSVVFAGFSSQSLSQRILDSNCKFCITSDGGLRGPKVIPLKSVVDEAVELCEKENFKLDKVIVLKRLGEKIKINWDEKLNVWYHDLMEKASADCPVVWHDSEDPLFMLYTSGSTGKPKALVHTTGGYMVWAATTFKYVFDYQNDDIYWCTADIGWITGHSYICYGPLCNGATSVMFEGVGTHPNPSRMWNIVDKYKVSLFYTAPTAIRALMALGKKHVEKTSRKTLRVLGSVGEPINPEAWIWYHEVVGDSKCEIVDTYWQTETGGFMLTPLPYATPKKPGSATKPFFGINPLVVDEKGTILEGECSGYLVMSQCWPGISRTIYGDHNRYEQVYFSTFPGYYLTGDGCRRDKDGYYWITGRIDDVLSISGHRLGTAEIESALVAHENVAEAAIVPVPHDITGQAIYAYVTLRDDVKGNNDLKKELVQHVRKSMGAICTIGTIHWAPGLPKTRSGKIMRRILRKIAEHEDDKLGDISTLADPSVVQTLIDLRGK